MLHKTLSLPTPYVIQTSGTRRLQQHHHAKITEAKIVIINQGKGAFNTSASHRRMLPLSLCCLETSGLGICSHLLFNNECLLQETLQPGATLKKLRVLQSVCPKAERFSETLLVKHVESLDVEREDPPGFPNTASSSLRVGLHPSADPQRSLTPNSGQ